jgi:glycosyltransferase 2 family protein
LSGAQRGRLAVGGILALLLLYWFFRGMDLDRLGVALGQARDRPHYLLGVVGATVLVYLARAWRWGYLLSPLARVPFVDLFSATMVGFGSGMLIPRAGEIVRPYLVSRRHPVTVSAGFATIILERILDLLTVLFLLGLYLYVLPAPAAQTHGPLFALLQKGGLLVGAGAIALVLVLLAFHVHADRALALCDRLLTWLPAWLRKPLAGILRSFSEGLAVLQAPALHLLAIVAQSALVWLLIALGFHWTHVALGIDLPFRATFLLAAFLTVGVAIPTPGMVGGFHAFYLIALHEAFGVEKETAVAAGLVAHALSTLPVVVLGLAFLGREGITLGRVAQMSDAADPQEVRT